MCRSSVRRASPQSTSRALRSHVLPSRSIHLRKLRCDRNRYCTGRTSLRPRLKGIRSPRPGSCGSEGRSCPAPDDRLRFDIACDASAILCHSNRRLAACAWTWCGCGSGARGDWVSSSLMTPREMLLMVRAAAPLPERRAPPLGQRRQRRMLSVAEFVCNRGRNR